MNNYNNAIIPLMIDYIKKLLERIEIASNDGASITLVKYQLIDSNNLDVNYLTTHGMTGTFTLKIHFSVKNGDEVTNFNEDLEIPKLVNNVFVIDGSLRIPTNTLDNDDTVTVYSENIRINDILNIQYQEDPAEPNGYKVTASIYEDEEPIIVDCIDEEMQKYSGFFRLTEEERDKIKVKLDDDDIPEILNRDILIRLITLGSDKLHDNMIDKKIYSAESNLMKYLWSRDIRRKILSSMRQKFFQYNRVYLRDIQLALDRYFRIASEKNIDIPTTVNPLVFDALKYKVVIPRNVTFNRTMSDIIDVANTPINGNVNRINELNVCTVIRDNTIYIKCYKYPTQEPVEVAYTHYCTKKVLLNSYWDYDKKQFKSGITECRYKERLKVKDGHLSDKFEYIEPKADDKLSITTRRIPFGNKSDSVRVSMATSMQKQAVEVERSEPSLVTAGYDDTDFELSTLITRFHGENAVVDKIKDNKIFIKDLDTGSVEFIEVPAPTVGQNDSVISFESIVKEGQQLKKDDVIIVPHSLKRKSFESGTNANIIYLNYLGMTYEDGMVISQSYADKMAYYAVLDVGLPLYPDDIIKFIHKVGSKVTSRDILVNNQTRLRVSSTLKDTYTGDSGLLRGMGISFSQNNLIVPNNVDEGYIVDCKIFIREDGELTSEYTKKIIEEYSTKDIVNDYKNIPEKYKTLKASDIEISEKAIGFISYKLVKIDRCIIGAKITNKYGGKGMVSLVLPDECMPYVEHPDGSKTVADLVSNPAGVLHRKNISQIWEAHCGKMIIEIYKRVNNMVIEGRIKEAKQFLVTYYGNEFESMTDEEFRDNHYKKGIYAYRMKVGFYSTLDLDTVNKWLTSLGLKETDVVYCPSITLVEDPKIGMTAYPLGEYKPVDGVKYTDYELGYCEQECVTGNGYIMRLFHSAEYSGKATPEIFDIPEPVMGRGNYRDQGGQKIGEMELWSLLATGSEEFVRSQSPDMLTNQYVFLNEMLLAGYYISDANKNPMLSNLRSNYEALQALDKKEDE